MGRLILAAFACLIAGGLAAGEPDGAPCVTVSPATDRCEYVTEGRASLVEGAWSDALYDGTHRFFRVTARPKTGQ